MPRVNIPNLGTVNFPDSMSSADIEHESGKLYLSYANNLPGAKSFIPPKGQLPGESSGQSFTERAAGRVEQNLMMPGKLLDMFPNAISSALQLNSGMTDRGKATLYPFGDSTPARIAGIATVAQRQTYGMAKDLVKQWMTDPATAVGDVATVALPLAESRVPANKQFSPSVSRGTSEATAGQLLRQELLARIPGASRVGIHKPTFADYADLFSRKAEEPASPWAGAEVDPIANLSSLQAWWKRRGGVLVADRPAGDPFIRAPRPQPSVPSPAVQSNISRVMNTQDEQSIIDSIRADLERHGRAAQAEYRAANTVDVPKGTLVESAMEQLRRRANIPKEQPMPNMIPEGQRASDIITQEQAEAIGNRIMARGETKAGIESGKVGTTQGALSDTALFQQAKAELPNGTVSDWAKRAQELKMRQVPTGTVKYTTTPPSPAKQNLNDPNVLMDLLKKSVAKAKTKKGQPRPKQ